MKTRATSTHGCFVLHHSPPADACCTLPQVHVLTRNQQRLSHPAGPTHNAPGTSAPSHQCAHCHHSSAPQEAPRSTCWSYMSQLPPSPACRVWAQVLSKDTQLHSFAQAARAAARAEVACCYIFSHAAYNLQAHSNKCSARDGARLLSLSATAAQLLRLHEAVARCRQEQSGTMLLTAFEVKFSDAINSRPWTCSTPLQQPVKG